MAIVTTVTSRKAESGIVPEARGSSMPPKMLVSCPFLLVADVRRAAEYYRDRLGFRIIAYFFEEPPVFAMVDRDRAEIHLALATRGRGGPNRRWRDDALDAYIRVEDVDGLYDELKGRQADIVAPPILRSYGMKELEVRDADGYVICFGQEIGG